MTNDDPAMVYDAFISYRHAEPDKTFARNLRQELIDAGFKIALDEIDFRPNAKFLSEMERCIKESRFTLAVISPRYLQSGNCEEEAIICKVLDMAERKYRLIPLILEAVEMPTWLYSLVGIRFDEEAPLLDPYQKLIQTLSNPLHEPHHVPENHLPLHNLPLDTLGDLFKGREGALATLHASLTQNKTTAVVQKQAIHGLGGIGKTRLAIEYAYRYAREYTALLFVRADAPAAVHANLAALADLLNLPERDAREEPVKTAAVLHWLETNPGWLLILDNVDAEAAAAAVLPLLPRLNNGCVLITTRRAHWSPAVKRHELDILAIKDAAAYLLERTEHDRAKSPEDQQRAEELAKKLDGLPLALELAAAYIASRHWSFDRYLQIWETERESVLEWHDTLQTEYPFSLAFAWQTSFDQLPPQARFLLNICAFLAPDPIPEFLFESQEDLLQKALDVVQETGKKKKKSSPQIPFDVTEALAGLYTYSLITPEENNAFSLHRLVQEVVRSRLPNDSHPLWIQIALALINAATPFETDDVRTWPVMNLLHPHALTITAQADILGISEPTARLMNQFGLFLEAKALFIDAEPLLRRTLEINEISLGHDHLTVAICLNNLAQLLQATNRLEEAEPLMRRALEIFENSLGSEHSNVAACLNNLAQLLQATNRLAEAEPLMRRALEIWENSLGPEHPNVAACLNNLAQLLQATNRLTEAEPLMRRALDIDENSFGPDHPKVAIRLNNLAQLLQATNRLAEAEPLMRRALDIDENSFG
ncbi:MAG TPA: toll/interleukin-1 receptor domain-containing protein, partial [Candidatus Hydrogenedentes bacterium]|nr:toll/interleukin-1 receptor domain-containing protein [Candidatus Hydrogenedentota bacterium]